VAFPTVSAPLRRVRVRVAAAGISAGTNLSESKLLLDRRDYGCISMTCDLGDGRHPFVFQPLRKSGLVPFAFLIYCRHLEDVVRHASPLGRFLVSRGVPLVIVDENGSE
jgi:hypothetical protein